MNEASDDDAPVEVADADCWACDAVLVLSDNGLLADNDCLDVASIECF